MMVDDAWKQRLVAIIALVLLWIVWWLIEKPEAPWIVLVAFALIVLSFVVLTRALDLAAWILGLSAVAATPVLLEIAARFTEAPDSTALRRWAFVYGAGALGGLVLELVVTRWRPELPSAGLPPAVGTPPANTTGTPSTPDERGPDSFAPYGTQLDVGFLGRLASSGLAAAVFMVLLKVAADAGDANELSATLTATATKLDTLAWAALLGAVSPTVWKAAESIANTRLAALQENQRTAEEQITEATNTLTEPGTQEPVVELEVSDESVDQLAATVDGNEIRQFLLDHPIKAVGRPDTQRVGETIGLLRAAQIALARNRQ